MTIRQRAGWYIVQPGVIFAPDPYRPWREGERVYIPSAALAEQLQILGRVAEEGVLPDAPPAPALYWRGRGGWFLWQNTGADPVDAESPVDLGGVYGFALFDIPSGAFGELALTGVWEFGLPDGVAFFAGDIVCVDGLSISDSGEPVGVAVSDSAQGRVRVHLLPGCGGGGGTGDTVRWDRITGKPDFADVAFSGDYDDLINKPPGGGGDAVLQEALTATKAVGGVTVGTSWPAGTPLEDILRRILNPVENPTFTAPSATLNGGGTRLLEPGSTASVTLSVAFDRGKITPAYGTSGKRSGEATGYSLNGGAQQAGNSFTVTVSEANRSFRAAVSYAAGEQPKDSAGNDFGEPLPAGSVNTNTLVWEFVNALWSNEADIAVMAKDALVSKSAGVKSWNFPAMTAAQPHAFDVPAAWNVVAVEFYDPVLTRAWQDCAAEFAVTDASHDGVAYKRYTDKRGYAAGGRQVRVRWTP